ncbi:MAG: hypothetical protein J6W52_08310 [Bacteroidaceae bacterium]|nr:hypothetical protein [Bacteroidaceae bacterium]
MNNRIVNTVYAPSQPPYQIIYAGGEVGLQVGTLIVVEETRGEDDSYGIETHSHPVVNYCDKTSVSNQLKDMQDYTGVIPQYLPEAAVWNRVEIADIQVLGLQGEIKEICWLEFCRIVTNWGLYGKESHERFDIMARRLKSMGVDIIKNESEEVVVYLGLCGEEYHPTLEMIYDGFSCLYFALPEGKLNPMPKHSLFAMDGVSDYVNSALKNFSYLALSPNSNVSLKAAVTSSKKPDKWDKMLMEIVNRVNKLP